MNNKKFRKIILSTMSLFTFSSSMLFVGFNQSMTSNEQSTLENKPSFETQIDSKITKQETTLVEKATPTVEKRTIYPFQIDATSISQFVEIQNMPNPAPQITWRFSGEQNIGTDNQTGTIIAHASMFGYLGPNGTYVEEQWNRQIRITGFKSVTGRTTLTQNSFVLVNNYATDVVFGDSSDPSELSLSTITTINNPLDGIVSGVDGTTRIQLDGALIPSNKDGTLKFSYRFVNYFDNQGKFIKTPSPILEITLTGFKKVPGPTQLELVTSSIVSNINADNFQVDMNNWSQFFRVINNIVESNSNQTHLSSIQIIGRDSEKGTVTIKYGITGKYYNKELIETNATQEVFIEQTISGFSIEKVGLDITMIAIGSAAGGVVLITAIALTIFLVSKSKKKKSENLRKQKMSEKVSPPGTGTSPSTPPMGGPRPTSGSVPPITPRPTPPNPPLGPRPPVR